MNKLLPEKLLAKNEELQKMVSKAKVKVPAPRWVADLVRFLHFRGFWLIRIIHRSSPIAVYAAKQMEALFIDSTG